MSQTEKGLVTLTVLGVIGAALLWLAMRDHAPTTVNGVPATSNSTEAP